MKRREAQCLDGGTIICLTPENEEDVKELRRLEKEGLLDTRHSFGDDPQACGADFTTEDIDDIILGGPKRRRRRKRPR